MKEKNLYIEISFENYGHTLTARCPDEDDEMSITIEGATQTLSIYEAEKLGTFLIEHVKNAKNQ